MKTITNNSVNEMIIKNSRFITLIYKINDMTNINSILEDIKGSYPKATHYCYAYRLHNYQKSSDDGEPGGTAGIPMLNVLIKDDLINILVVTVRYFGGIKLGAGGLVRAYTKSITSALALCEIEELKEGYIVEISTNYSNQKLLDYLLKDCLILDKKFKDDICYIVQIEKDKLNLIRNFSYKMIEEKLIEKK